MFTVDSPSLLFTVRTTRTHSFPRLKSLTRSTNCLFCRNHRDAVSLNANTLQQSYHPSILLLHTVIKAFSSCCFSHGLVYCPHLVSVRMDLCEILHPEWSACPSACRQRLLCYQEHFGETSRSPPVVVVDGSEWTADLALREQSGGNPALG